MSPAVAEILKATSTLTPAEKIELADSLYNEFPPSEFMDWDPDWLAEINRRSDEIDAGIASGRSWDEIQAELVREWPDDV
jgi:putative addiction module component (TIGR02574 family)